MTEQEFAERQTELLSHLPTEFRAAVAYKAWQDGHAYGYEEVLIHVEELTDMLLGPIQQYTTRTMRDLPTTSHR